MASLRLLLLGPPRLEREGRPVELNLRRATALLIYLAVTDRPQGRETLCALLWPDTAEQEARGRLRRTLYRLTEALSDGVLNSAGGVLGLSPGADLWLDCRAFEEHAATGLALVESPPPDAERLTHLTRAADLYTDDFLSGFGLPDSAAWDEWQFLQREALQQTFGRVLRSLVRTHRAEGAWGQGIGYARRWLALDPLHEPAQRALMRLYALAGQQAAALRQYRECVRLLDAELGAAPESRTTALYEVIKSRRLAPPPPTFKSAEPPMVASDISGAAPSAAPSPASPRPRPRLSLPAQPTALIGRDREQELIVARLLQENTRLLTLTGPGGVGKTRLALQVAANVSDCFEGGVSFVGLGPVLDPDLVGTTIAEALGVAQAAGRPVLESVEDHLREQELLLVIDNFEHLVTAAPVMERLLVACRRLKVLATSRAALRVRGENEFPVLPLALPTREHVLSLPELASNPSIALFVERARDSRPNFSITSENGSAVAEICCRLDGLPLAIELAAARVKMLPPWALLARLEHTLTLLTRGPRDVPTRQQTLRNAIGWSYDLLSAAEQALFRRLSVFVGGFTLEAAAAVGASSSPDASREDQQARFAGTGENDDAQLTARDAELEVLDDLASLVDASLLQREDTGDGESRFGMLATIREFAQEQLHASGEDRAAHDRHTAYYVGLAERSEPALEYADEAGWFDRLDAERDNLRAVERRAAARGDAETVVRLGAALWQFWMLQADAAEARERVDAILSLAELTPRSSARAKALDGAAVLARLLGDYPAARALGEQCLAIARELDDRRRFAVASYNLGRVAYTQGRYADARELLEAALVNFRQIGHQSGIAGALNRLGFLAFSEGDLNNARPLWEESLATARSTGYPRLVGSVLFNLGLSAHFGGDLESARQLYEECRAINAMRGDWHDLAMALHALAHATAMQGDLPAARALYRECVAIAHQAGNRLRLALALWTIATLAASERDWERAVRLSAAAEASAAAIGVVPARPMRELWNAQIEPARRALGTEDTAAAVAAGRTLTLERAIDEAVIWLREPDEHTQEAPPASHEQPSPSGLRPSQDAGVHGERKLAV
jgi:predicted ATPase/DNA-binding SARP family transcriptional activator